MSETMYDRIKRLRIEKNMSQEELALKSGYTSRSTINKIEKGERNITGDKIQAIVPKRGLLYVFGTGFIPLIENMSIVL